MNMHIRIYHEYAYNMYVYVCVCVRTNQVMTGKTVDACAASADVRDYYIIQDEQRLSKISIVLPYVFCINY